jgi:hypothetical protein
LLVKVGGERLFVVERHFKSCDRVAAVVGDW